MKILLLYDYPPSPGGLATQGELLHRGLNELGAHVEPAHFESPEEKEWCYRWFEPDVVVGVGYWGHAPHIIYHPRRYGIPTVPWLVADGYVANYRSTIRELPLVLVTSNWVKDVYVRDGVDPEKVEVLPVGCDTDSFIPRDRSDRKVTAVRETLGVAPDQVMILTIGGDAASKGAHEMMQALSMIDLEAPDWKYVCKVWSQPRTEEEQPHDLKLASDLGIDKSVYFVTGRISRRTMPYLMAACDIYAAPSRLEGFGMCQVEAQSCSRPVLSINAMGPQDTIVHGETGFLAEVEKEISIREADVGEDQGYGNGDRVHFSRMIPSDYRASVQDLADYLMDLMADEQLRRNMGQAGRERAVELFDYRKVARRLLNILSERLGLE